MGNQFKILIVGAGTMGRGIAEVYGTKGFDTVLYDLTDDQLEKAKASIMDDLSYLSDEGIMTDEEVKQAKKSITYSTDMEKSAADADMVIECVFENPDVKREVFGKLDKYCRQDCLLCTNTSGSNIFDIVDISNPERLLITHYFNPAYVMPLVEVVGDKDTTSEIYESVIDILKSVGKEPSVIRQYIPGFIVNRIATAIVREASHMITEGWTTGEDIDRAIRNTSGLRYGFEGPLALYDIVGWDLTTTVSGDIQKTLCNDTKANKLGLELIEQGELGIKSGKGIYDYHDIDIQSYMHRRAHNIIRMKKALDGDCGCEDNDPLTSGLK